MKPFDPTKPVQLRDGRPARILCTDTKGLRPILALHLIDGLVECPMKHYRNGQVGDSQCGVDLVNVPVKKWKWVYSLNGFTYVTDRHYANKNDVKGSDYFTIIGRILESEIEE